MKKLIPLLLLISFYGHSNVIINHCDNNSRLRIDPFFEMCVNSNFRNIDNYLDRFQDVATYRNAPCLANGCNRAQMQNFLQQQRNQKNQKSNEVNQTNRAIIKGIEAQQQQMQQDALTPTQEFPGWALTLQLDDAS